MVIQRDASNQASVQIAGSYSQDIDLVEARAVARAAGQGTTTAWATLDANPTNGQFNGNITVKGGWYTIQVRGVRGGSPVVKDSVDKFGVGEVFAIIGHSNAQGSSCVVGGVNKCPTIDGASDERVTVVAVDQRSTSFQQYLNTADMHFLPGLAFSQLLTYSGSAPFGDFAWLWGHMGDELVKRINVPVLLYNAGFGGTTIRDNYWAAYNIPFQHSFVRYDLRMPYANLRNLMNLYVPTTGIRAVLIQHGENDRGNPTDSTFKYYNKVIDKVRAEFNKPDLGCIIALSSFVGARFDNVRAAQFQIIGLPNYKAFQGPDLDNINTLDDRPDGIHFSPSGQVKAGDAWATSISGLWSSISPYLALNQPRASLQCAPANQLTLIQPAGYQYEWNTGSTVQSLTVGTGMYSARLKDNQSRIFFPPAIVVPTTVQPSPPTLTSDNGTWNICRTTGLKLTSSFTGQTTWSTGVTSSSIVVKTPGVYSLQAKQPVYGCLSSVVSQTVGLGGVDLDLGLQTSRRVVAVNDTLGFRLSIRNNSDCDAGPVTVISRLPSNVSIVSPGKSMTVASNVLTSIIPAVPAGAVVSQQFTGRLAAAGYYRTTAEITASTNKDINATPNNGTGNGESDEALADFRTSSTLSPSPLYESPNPSQSPLAAVQSSQPAPDAAKSDLSLQIQSSRQTMVVGQQVDIKLIVSNLGGLAATNVTVRNVLPPNLQFVSSSSGMTITAGALNGSISQIAVGQSATLTFTVKVVSSGICVNQGQIMSAGQPDPDSTPGNGYTNGEDDQASITLRIFSQI